MDRLNQFKDSENTLNKHSVSTIVTTLAIMLSDVVPLKLSFLFRFILNALLPLGTEKQASSFLNVNTVNKLLRPSPGNKFTGTGSRVLTQSRGFLVKGRHF